MVARSLCWLSLSFSFFLFSFFSVFLFLFLWGAAPNPDHIAHTPHNLVMSDILAKQHARLPPYQDQTQPFFLPLPLNRFAWLKTQPRRVTRMEWWRRHSCWPRQMSLRLQRVRTLNCNRLATTMYKNPGGQPICSSLPVPCPKETTSDHTLLLLLLAHTLTHAHTGTG